MTDHFTYEDWIDYGDAIREEIDAIMLPEIRKAALEIEHDLDPGSLTELNQI